MPYNKTTWVNNQPPSINATRLNNLESQYDAVAADVGDGATPVGAALNSTYGRVFDVASYPTIHDAYDALVLAGGGTLQVRGTIQVASDFVIDQNVPCHIDGHGGVLVPAPGVVALSLEVGPTLINPVVVDGLEIDATTSGGRTGGAVGVRVRGHLGAVIRDVTVRACGIGLLITDASGKWSESSSVDRFRSEGCLVGIEFATAGGTGSFGYASWGRVAIYDVPEGGVGFKVGAGAFLYHFDIGMLVIQTAQAVVSGTATLMQIAGTVRRASAINAVLESSGNSFSGTRNGLSLLAGANIDGLLLRIYFQGVFSNVVLNPSSIAFQIRETNDRDVKGNSSAQDLAAYWVYGEAFPRTVMRAGRLMMGSGAAAVDAQIVRWGANEIGTDSGDTLRVSDGTWNGGHLRMGNYRIWVDAAGVLRIKNGAPASDTDGTIVGTQS